MSQLMLGEWEGLLLLIVSVTEGPHSGQPG